MTQAPSTETTADPPARGSGVPAVALVASAGGLHALGTVLASLPAGFPAPILVLEHLQPNRESALPGILARLSPLPVKEAVEGDRIAAGTVYVAPPDAHMLVRDGRILLDDRPPVGHLRPRADLLLASLESGSVGVVLSGTGNDGASGVETLAAAGGTVIAEDPATAQFPGMPSAAVETGLVDEVLPLEAIPEALVRLASREDV